MSKDSLLDVLQETKKCKVEEVTRFCHKLIRYVREFIEEDDLDIFGQDFIISFILFSNKFFVSLRCGVTNNNNNYYS